MKKLKMTIQGGWELVFEPHNYCGNARDSLSLRCHTYISQFDKPGMVWKDLGVINRTDLKRLRDKIDEVLAHKAKPLVFFTSKK